MRLTILWRSLALALLTIPALAQDTHYAPVGQQFPSPGCFTQKGAWQGGSKPCTLQDFDDWLKDITHWRTERRIRIGYSNDRYQCEPDGTATMSVLMVSADEWNDLFQNMGAGGHYGSF